MAVVAEVAAALKDIKHHMVFVGGVICGSFDAVATKTIGTIAQNTFINSKTIVTRIYCSPFGARRIGD